MFKNEELTKKVLERIVEAESATLEAMRDTRAEHEPTITDRLIANIENGLNGKVIAKVRWQAKTLTSIGKKSQEVRHGADLLGVLDLKVPGYHVTKGFLVQAKKLEPRDVVSSRDYSDLANQCHKMLNRSPVSFVFIYSLKFGIRVVSALDILSAHQCNPLTLKTWTLRRFFEAHFQCFIGDFRLRAANVNELEGLARDLRTRNGILIGGRSTLEEGYRNVIK